MILVRYAASTGPAYGLLRDREIYTLEGDPFADSLDLSATVPGQVVGAVDEVKLLAPCAPTKIVAVGLNYAEHTAECGREAPSEPLLFFKPPSAVIGPGAPIILPPQTLARPRQPATSSVELSAEPSERVEHEAELCLVIGRRCRNVSPDGAWDVVLGVTCGNDVTARDLQRRDKQWTRAKGFDTSAPLGPWVVTGLSAADVSDLSITCQVNGVYRQRARTKDMVFSPSELVSYITQMITLQPGDVVMTGTPAGVGPLKAGDLVEVTIEGIGTLANPVVAA
jgi:2-keto-4-pentenoate hydratase/2-oxohepta-3-ene-1,7-dioic acid hydratase in catechol pathway